jgi:hypothetical protein
MAPPWYGGEATSTCAWLGVKEEESAGGVDMGAVFVLKSSLNLVRERTYDDGKDY